MYQLINNGLVVGNYIWFYEAWLQAYLNYNSWSMIINGKEKWIINPPHVN